MGERWSSVASSMPEPSVDRALTDRGHTVNSVSKGFSGRVSCVYDAPTMRLNTTFSLALVAAAATSLAPLGARGADAPGAAGGVTLTATRAVGAEAVTISGNAPVAQPLEAALYATFSKDLPTTLLSRRAVPTDAQGHYSMTLPVAPAFFRSAIVTVVIRVLPTGPSARTTFPVGAPNLPAPPDDIPSSVS
jgi:hypothetical protein